MHAEVVGPQKKKQQHYDCKWCNLAKSHMLTWIVWAVKSNVAGMNTCALPARQFFGCEQMWHQQRVAPRAHARNNERCAWRCSQCLEQKKSRLHKPLLQVVLRPHSNYEAGGDAFGPTGVVAIQKGVCAREGGRGHCHSAQAVARIRRWSRGRPR